MWHRKRYHPPQTKIPASATHTQAGQTPTLTRVVDEKLPTKQKEKKQDN
jgi:hypothetical protein